MGMVFVRRHLSGLIGVWLVCQLAGVTAAPVTFCCKDVPTSHDEADCCAGLLPGQLCPMHHTTAGKRECKMRNACGPSDAALMALAGSVGPLVSATPVVSAFELGETVCVLTATAILRADRPESPPPRA
jgi:hypothetical protein